MQMNGLQIHRGSAAPTLAFHFQIRDDLSLPDIRVISPNDPKRFLHRVDLAKVEARQQNGLRPFFSALETFFSPCYLRRILKNGFIQKHYSHSQLRIDMKGPNGISLLIFIGPTPLSLPNH